MKKFRTENVVCEKIVGGGQALGQLKSGKKVFVWGALPGEKVIAQIYKSKSSFCEAVATEILEKSSERIDARDPDSYLSTSPWQIMNFDYETSQKSQLIREAFELSHVELPNEIVVETDGREFEYRNKIEFSFWFDTERETLDLAFFRRGTHGKIPILQTSLAGSTITNASQNILKWLRKVGVEGRALKTLLIRSNRAGDVCAQLYVKDLDVAKTLASNCEITNLRNFEIIFSNPKSPASVITEKVFATSDKVLSDEILGVKFNYATEGFFQINLPVYEMALREMKKWITTAKSVDMYSGVGTIGLTIGGLNPTLVEVNEAAVGEMRRNVSGLGINANVVLAKSEDALEHIDSDADLIVDPPRAGLHDNVCGEILRKLPPRVIYLSCNPVTQARDVAKLCEKYEILHHVGYNFFPRTPHIEHLVILERK